MASSVGSRATKEGVLLRQEPPERAKITLLRGLLSCYQESQTLLQTTSLQNCEATSLLARVNTLHLSLTGSMTALEHNRDLRALNLANDPLVTALDKLSLGELPSDIHILSQSTPPDIAEAFSSIIKPLTAIKEVASTLFERNATFTLPTQTAPFFREQFFGHHPQRSEKRLSQGNCSSIQAHSFRGHELVLKATKDPTQCSKETIEDQQKQLDVEACVYMRLFPGLEAYTDKGLWLQAAKQDFFDFYDEHQPLSLEQLPCFFKQIAQQIYACHEAGIVLNDFKPENILVEIHDELTTLRLCDFGFASKNGQSTQRLQASPFYAAPSQLDVESDISPPTSPLNDCWAFGIWMYECIAGLPPFYDAQGIEDAKRDLSEAIRQNLQGTETRNTDMDYLAQKLIRVYNISLESLSSDQIQKAISHDANLYVYKNLVQHFLERQCNTFGLFPRNFKERDPQGVIEGLIIRCLNIYDPHPVTMKDIIDGLNTL